MIMLATNTDMGNIIHFIAGPESELFSDIHGATIIDISPLVSVMEAKDKLLCSFTKCKSEMATSAIMAAAGIPHFNSNFNSGIKGVRPPDTKDGAKPAAKSPEGICTYCKRETELVKIPGMKICAVCAQIELHKDTTKRKRKVSGDNKDAMA